MKILHLTEQSEHLRPPNSVRFAVALSRLMRDETDLGADMRSELVLLLSCKSATPDLRVSNLSGLEEGCEVHVWQPCHEVNLPMDVAGYRGPRSRPRSGGYRTNPAIHRSAVFSVSDSAEYHVTCDRTRLSPPSSARMGNNRVGQSNKRKVVVVKDSNDLDVLSQQSSSSDFAECASICTFGCADPLYASIYRILVAEKYVTCSSSCDSTTLVTSDAT